MKGTAEIEVLLTIGIIVATIALIFEVFVIVDTIISEFSAASAEVVSRDVASLITISASAPHDITIHYTTDRAYKLEFENRFLRSILQTTKPCSELFPTVRAEVKEAFCQALSKFGVSSLSGKRTGSTFTIQKTASKDGLNVAYSYNVNSGGS